MQSYSPQWPVFACLFFLIVLLNLIQIFYVLRTDQKRVKPLHATMQLACIVSGFWFMAASVAYTVNATNDVSNFMGLVFQSLGFLCSLGFLMKVIYTTFIVAIVSVDRTMDGSWQKWTLSVLLGVLCMCLFIMSVLTLFFNSMFWVGIFTLFYLCIYMGTIVSMWISFFLVKQRLINPALNVLSPTAYNSAATQSLQKFQRFGAWISILSLAGSVGVILDSLSNIVNPGPFFGKQDNSATFSITSICGVLIFAWGTYYAWQLPSLMISFESDCVEIKIAAPVENCAIRVAAKKAFQAAKFGAVASAVSSSVSSSFDLPPSSPSCELVMNAKVGESLQVANIQPLAVEMQP